MTYKKITVCIICFLFAGNVLYGATAREIIEQSEKSVRGNSLVSTYEMTIVTKRWTRTLKMNCYENRAQRMSFSEILAPKKDAGNRFLLIRTNMWHYIASLQQIIKISPSTMMQAWMGSDFSNDDIVKESSIVNDYTHTILSETTVDGHACIKVELLPKPEAAVVWGKIHYFVRKSDYLPVRQEFYNEHNVLKKVMTCSDFKSMGGRMIPTLYKMQSPDKSDRYTTLTIKAIQYDVAIPPHIFTQGNLTRK